MIERLLAGNGLRDPAGPEGRRTTLRAAPAVFLVSADATLRRSQTALLAAHRIAALVFDAVGPFLAAYDGRRGCVSLDAEGPGEAVACVRRLRAAGVALPLILLTDAGRWSPEAVGLGAGVIRLAKPPPSHVYLNAVRRTLTGDGAEHLADSAIVRIKP